MQSPRNYTILVFVLILGFAIPGSSQKLSEELKTKVDAVILEAYQAASAKFPCKIKDGGKRKILHWQEVEKCLNNAEARVDWEGLSGKLQAIRENGKYYSTDVLSAIEASLSAHAIPYEKVFRVKETEALLPLSNSLLKFLPADSLMDLPVHDRTGARIGTFSGVYTFEKMGQISGTRMLHALFQYTDANGKMQSSPDKLLLDSYSVPWKGAIAQPGFRLPAEKLVPGR
jgi:hypothetical protein